ncbi:MAG: HAMP domain-containing sensor histidine kinase [Bacteroidota bacterium]|nr:HAMP domain-containing sensor histidine kinase [Bacteroidota bacterium]
MNIKSILTIKFTGIVAAILLVFSIFTYQFSDLFRKSQFPDRVKKRSKNTVSTFLDKKELTVDILKLLYVKGLNRYPSEQLLILDSNKNQIFSSHAPSKIELDLMEKLFNDNSEYSISKSDTEYISYIVPHQTGNYYVVSSAIDKVGHEKIKFLMYLLMVLFFTSIFVVAASGWIFSQQALKPISLVVSQVAMINEKNLHERVNEGNGKDEIAHLAIVFNKMLERLENSFIIQKSFVSNASHEFRTPLTVMKGQIEVLLLHKRNEEEYIQTFQSLLDDIQNQIQLINSLAELARANADFPHTSFKKISILEVIIESREELMRLKNRFKVQLEWGDFPEDDELLHTFGDFSLLKSAFINLMDNACKFSIDHKCLCKVNFNKYFIEIYIEDKGVGINQEELPYIFEPFYRSNQTRSVHGYGIGLSLVKKTIDIHQGNISVHSEEGIGTRIKVQLPNVIQLGV